MYTKFEQRKEEKLLEQLKHEIPKTKQDVKDL